MDFSWSYEDTMRRMITDSSCCNFNTSQDAAQDNVYSLMLKVDLPSGQTYEIPTMLLGRLEFIIPQHGNEEDRTIIVPLFTDGYTKQCAGAEAIMKYFTRANCRLNKVITPKGETYYGNNGIILDENFNPLMLSTATITCDAEGTSFLNSGYNIYLAPSVFTDDTKLLNKSLAKKGIAYYLSHAASTWRNNVPYKVIIDDCSKFLVKAHRPDLSSHLDRELTQVLKDNIDEVLRQIADDYRSNF